MIATRIGRLATVCVFSVAWLAAAFFLWQTNVPSSVDVGGLNVHDVFSRGELGRAERYQRVVNALWVLQIVANVIALYVLSLRTPRLARTIGLGRIGTGVIISMLVLVTLWFVSLPFGFVGQWWQARHGLAPHDYLSWIF